MAPPPRPAAFIAVAAALPLRMAATLASGEVPVMVGLWFMRNQV